MLPLLLIIIGSGCSHGPRIEPEIGWPPPPEEPRIVYVQSLLGEQSLKRSFFGKIKDFLFGGAPKMVIGKPYGVAFDGKSKLFIADTAKKGVMVLDMRSGTTKFINSLGPYGALVEPVYVLLDRENNIYVSDTKLKRVAVFDDNYEFSHFVGSETDFEGPVGMAFNKNQTRLYIVDTQKHLVKIFDPNGTCLGEIGRRGDEKGEFHFPLTVAVDKEGRVYIVDSFHFAVQAFDSTGEFLNSFGPGPTGGSSTMARPRDIAIDSDGHLYITDAVRNNIQIYSDQGELLMTFGSAGKSAGEFLLPAGIFIDNDDNIYISDSINRRIQMFKYLARN